MLGIRVAKIEDMNTYYEWANDEVVRANSFNSNFINFDEHSVWFENKLHSKNCLMLVFLENNKPAGQVRFDINGELAIINFSLAENYRGRGLSSEMLTLSTNYFFSVVRCDLVQGHVKFENKASQKAFIKAGFERFEQLDKIIFTRKRK